MLITDGAVRSLYDISYAQPLPSHKPTLESETEEDRDRRGRESSSDSSVLTPSDRWAGLSVLVDESRTHNMQSNAVTRNTFSCNVITENR